MSSFPVHHQFLQLTQTHIYWVSDAILPSHPLSSPSPSAFNLSQHQGIFQWVALRIRQPKYWSFSFSISPSNEYSGLVFFRIDWFDLLAVQRTLKGLLQHHSMKASILSYHATIGKTYLLRMAQLSWTNVCLCLIPSFIKIFMCTTVFSNFKC